MKSVIRKLLALVFLFAFSTVAQAVDEKPKLDMTYFDHPSRMWCPESVKPTDPRNTHIFFSDNPILLTDKVRIRENGVMYNIPAGYTSPWPSDEPQMMAGGLHGMAAMSDNLKPRELNIRDSVGFSFWYPSGRFPELDWSPVNWSRTCEMGRPLPKDNEFIAFGEVSDGPVRFGPTTPLEEWAEMDKYIKDGSLKYVGEQYGLLKYQFYDEPGKINQSVDYISKKGQIPQIHATCDNPRDYDLNPRCYCDIYYSKDMSFVLHIPNYNFPEWKKIANMAKGLILSWREKNPQVDGVSK